MRAVLQRVKKAEVEVDQKIVGKINQGMLVLLGIEHGDDDIDIKWLVNKILNLRIFNDEEGKMNLSITDIEGEILIVSQFTLHASTKKGMRPSFIKAAKPEKAEELYNMFIHEIGTTGSLKVETGIFGAMMDVSLINDGPVTLIIDSKSKE